MTVRIFCLSLFLSAGCISVQRNPNQPNLYTQVDEACRAQAEYYNDPAPVYVKCMKKRGYKGVTEANY